MAKLRLDDVVGEHRVEHLAGKSHAIVHQHLIVVLEVLSHLEDFLVLIHRTEQIHNFSCLVLVGRHRNVKSLVFLHRKAQSHEFSVYSID